MQSQTIEILAKYKTKVFQHMEEIINKEDKQTLLSVKKADMERLKEIISCKDCERVNPDLCDIHWHDYIICDNNNCLYCFILRSIGSKSN